jgi:hypothetical protein
MRLINFSIIAISILTYFCLVLMLRSRASLSKTLESERSRSLRQLVGASGKVGCRKPEPEIIVYVQKASISLFTSKSVTGNWPP